jgi:hypothetical protein
MVSLRYVGGPNVAKRSAVGKSDWFPDRRGRSVTPMIRLSALLLLVAAGSVSAQQDLGHRFEVTPAVARAAVGDPVTLRFSIHLHERDLVTDSLPRPTGELPEGVRILRVGKLARNGDRALTGEATVAIYRTGLTALPVFEIPFLRVSANMRGTIRSEPTQLEIVSMTPPGNPSLKDLKGLAPVGGVDWLPLGIAGVVAVVAALAVRAWRRRPSRRPSGHPAIRPSGHPVDPFDVALAQLAGLEPSDLAAVADVIRGCLVAATGIPALEQTSSELLRALPPHLNGRENRARLSELLADADLVKFACARADPAASHAFFDSARALLTGWRDRSRDPAGSGDAPG